MIKIFFHLKNFSININLELLVFMISVLITPFLINLHNLLIFLKILTLFIIYFYFYELFFN